VPPEELERIAADHEVRIARLEHRLRLDELRREQREDERRAHAT
jgi:hypothetical protein